MADPASVEVEGLPEFLRALRRYAPEVRKDFNREARTAANVIVSEARTRAGWSRRVPASVTVGPTVTGQEVGVRISRRVARHGPLYERGSKGTPGVIRHPLFGNREHWYSTPVRPFLAPAVEANESSVIEAMLRAVASAQRGADLA